MKKLAFAVACVAIVGAFVYAASQFRERRATQLDFMAREQAATFVRPHSPTLGAAEARVVIVEFTDPACETCAAFAPLLEEALARHPSKVRLVVRYAPFHAGSDVAVRALEAARLQGRFWETLHLLYANQGAWTHHHQVLPERIFGLLPYAGLDLERLEREMNDPRAGAIVAQDLADARTLGVSKTPGIFVNGRPLEPFGVETFRALVEAEVRATYPD